MNYTELLAVAIISLFTSLVFFGVTGILVKSITRYNALRAFKKKEQGYVSRFRDRLLYGRKEVSNEKLISHDEVNKILNEINLN